MTQLDIHPDIEDNGLGFTDPKRKRPEHGYLTDIGLLRAGTSEGRPTVGMRVLTDDGREIFVETTWRLLRQAYTALVASPLGGEPDPGEDSLTWVARLQHKGGTS